MAEEQEAGPGRPRGLLIGLGPGPGPRPERIAGPTRKRVPGWAGLSRASGMRGRGEAGLESGVGPRERRAG